jgi:exodeoxyribonuclease-3
MVLHSWNVNGIRSVEKKGFLQWLAKAAPDVLCVQETKARPEQLQEGLLRPADEAGRPYFSYWASAKKAGYSGTAIYSLVKPLEVAPLGEAEFDDEGRVLQAYYDGFVLICAYFPNSQEGGARLGYKLDFCAAIFARCNELVRQGQHVVICGDYNIAHTAIDLAHPKENEGNPGYLPEERAWMDAFTAGGYADTFRRQHPGETGCYSWWSYRTAARERNIGWRIDYHCVDEAFLPRVKSTAILAGVAGSDHCPIELVLEDP